MTAPRSRADKAEARVKELEEYARTAYGDECVLRARVAELEKAIKDAPHYWQCHIAKSHVSGDECAWERLGRGEPCPGCTCWKSRPAW